MLRELGAQVIEADALGRAMMEPGQAVYQQIVERFGPEVVERRRPIESRPAGRTRLSGKAVCKT